MDLEDKNNSGMKRKIVSGLVWKFGERITAQMVSLVVSIILARHLSPKDYGAVALVMVFISIANVFVTSGFGTGLVQKKDADELDFNRAPPVGALHTVSERIIKWKRVILKSGLKN